MSRAPRWEIVRTDAGWHARFRSSNGAILVASETYQRRRNAVRAVEIVTGQALYLSPFQDWPEVTYYQHGLIEVRDVDEREQP